MGDYTVVHAEGKDKRSREMNQEANLDEMKHTVI